MERITKGILTRWSGRLTARECLICLTGMIEGIEERARQKQFT